MQPPSELKDTAYDAAGICNLADRFKALADSTRLQIIHLLMARGEMCVCEFMALLDLTQPNVSFHLKTLKHAGFVTARKEGKWMFYTLKRCAIEQFRADFGDVFDFDKWPENTSPSSSEIPLCRRMECGLE